MLNNYDIFPVATGVFFATSDLHKPPALQPKELHHAGWWTSCRWAASITIETWIPGLGLWVCKFGDGSGGIYLCILCDTFLYIIVLWEVGRIENHSFGARAKFRCLWKLWKPWLMKGPSPKYLLCKQPCARKSVRSAVQIHQLNLIALMRYVLHDHYNIYILYTLVAGEESCWCWEGDG